MKGKIFTEKDLSKRMKSKPDSITKPWLAAQTERYKVVAIDPTAPIGKREIIAEELNARIINRLPEKARRVMPLLLRMTAQDRVALLQAFNSDGSLVNPFEMV